jgi:NhaP-type Na+/H+ or K+/H+ antiporter
MSWAACVMFGAIISATDPIAVVVMLKELGVDKSLSTVIEGENLMNDGTALTLYLLTVTSVEGTPLTASFIAGKFF